jgi:hypothetical protein
MALRELVITDIKSFHTTCVQRRQNITNFLDMIVRRKDEREEDMGNIRRSISIGEFGNCSGMNNSV